MNEIEKLINKYKERKSKLKSNGDICIKETQDPFAKIAIKTFDLIFSEFIKDLQKLNKPDVIKSVCLNPEYAKEIVCVSFNDDGTCRPCGLCKQTVL